MMLGQRFSVMRSCGRATLDRRVVSVVGAVGPVRLPLQWTASQRRAVLWDDGFRTPCTHVRLACPGRPGNLPGAGDSRGRAEPG